MKRIDGTSDRGSVTDAGTNRRNFIANSTTIMMGGGLAVGYGGLALMAGRFLWSDATGERRSWLFVATVREMMLVDSRSFLSPAGEQVIITRIGETESAESFLALSSVCPHLGCQVHWQPAHDRFFCPCHNGAFDRLGQATSGPPFKAGQRLSRFELKIENNLLFVRVNARRIGQTVARSEVSDNRNGSES